MIKEKKDMQITYRVTKNEYEFIEREAQKANMTISDFARRGAMGNETIVIDKSVAILQELAPMSTVINLEKQNHKEERILEMEQRCRNIWQLLK